MRKSIQWVLTLLLLSSLLLAACGGSTPAEPAAADGANAAQPATGEQSALNRDPKTLVVLFDSSADIIDPGQTLNVANNVVQRGIYEGLLRLKGESVSEVEGVLAESWTTNEDKSEWTFKIRQGVKFHDGTICDAQAIYDSIATN